jgi:ABC-type bacteriocin/lantibiotic exporter with double-glycine peptidase domain
VCVPPSEQPSPLHKHHTPFVYPSLTPPTPSPLCGDLSPPQRNAKFKHHGKSNFELNVPEFTAAPGELVAVVGRVGAGKSSLFQAILGNMDPVQGSAETGGRVSFVPQNPWCQNLTLRDNITFGLPFEEEHYERVCVVLQLSTTIPCTVLWW